MIFKQHVSVGRIFQPKVKSPLKNGELELGKAFEFLLRIWVCDDLFSYFLSSPLSPFFDLWGDLTWNDERPPLLPINYLNFVPDFQSSKCSVISRLKWKLDNRDTPSHSSFYHRGRISPAANLYKIRICLNGNSNRWKACIIFKNFLFPWRPLALAWNRKPRTIRTPFLPVSMLCAFWSS